VVNQNELIGAIIGKTMGYAFQGWVFSEASRVFSPTTVLMVKSGVRCGSRIINYTAKNYRRIDFSDETIFSDAVEASFFAD